MSKFSEDQLQRAHDDATLVSEIFLSAERAQKLSALDGAQALTQLLQMADHPVFAGRLADTGRALAAGTHHAVEAQFQFEAAHAAFAKAIIRTPLPERGWGCTDTVCPWDWKKIGARAVERKERAARADG